MHRVVETNGIRMHIAEHGAGPLVLLCHGWPESWYSWRHQLRALGEAGYHAVAPDQRGYGSTDRPDAIDQCTLFHLVGDRSEEHTSELQSHSDLVCRLLLEKKKKQKPQTKC